MKETSLARSTPFSMASNPISRYITDHYITPAVEQRLADTVTKDTTAFAVGVLPQPNTDLKETIGQYPDSDYQLLYNIYQAHADVSACVALWAGGVTGNGWKIGLLDRAAEPTTQQRQQIDELTTWLKNPNPSKRFNRLLYELVEHMAITGDAYLNKVTDSKGRIVELWGVHAATVRIVADEHGAILGYIQRYHGSPNIATFKPNEISRFQLPSVINDLYGHSPLESVLGEVSLDLSALVANKAIFQNGFKPSLILMMKDGAKDAAERLKSLIQQKHTGAAHQHGIVAVSGVEKIEPYAQTLKDMEFTALRALTTEKVANAYGVPAIFLNQKGTSKYNTVNAEERQFYNGRIKPIQDIIAEIFTEEIIHSFSPDLAFYFNDTDAIRADALKANQAGILDDDEIRETYFFLPKKTPEQLAADDTRRQQARAQFQAQQPATADNPPSPPPASDTSPAATDEQAGTEATPTPAKQPAKKNVSKAVAPAELEAIRARRETIHDGLETTIHPEIVSFFDRQEQRYLDKLATTFPATKSVRKGVVDDVIAPYFDGSETDNHDLGITLYTELQPALNAGITEATLQISFTMDTAAQLKIVDDYLLKNALANANGINDTTKAQLTDTLRAGIADGEGIPELRNRVRSVFTQATDARATAIARSETAQAFEYANQRTMRESGVVNAKQFLTAEDERVCPICVPLDGVIVPLDEHFPGDLEPGSCHVSCRCTSIGVVDEPTQP